MKVLLIGARKSSGGPETWRKNLVTSSKSTSIQYIEPDYKNLKVNLWNELKKIDKVDVVHFFIFDLFSLIFYFVCLFKRKKMILTLHGDFIEEAKKKPTHTKLFHGRIFPLMLNSFNKITFPSEYLFKKISKEYPNIIKKSEIIYNPVELHFDKKKIKQIPILTITNFNYYDKCRGISLLIESLKNLNRILYVVGDGKYLEDFKTKYASDDIIFLGFRKDILNLINNSTLIIHSTFLDNLPTVVIETALLKKPILASKIGGIPEIVCKKSIFDNNVVSIVKKIRLMNDAQYLKKSVTDNFNISKKFSHHRAIERFEGVYASK